MLAQKARVAIKSVPLLYKMLLPGVVLFREARNAFARTEAETVMRRFRRYCAYLSKVVSEPTFVKVGANDGVTGDPCSDILIADQKWKGLLIEPVPYCADRLMVSFHDARRFLVERVAIGATAGKRVFFYVDQQARNCIPDLPPWFDQLGSFDRDHILKHLNGILEPFIVECVVEVHPLSDVLRKSGIRDIHLLHIDTEGYDYEVLKTVDFTIHTPVVIFAEHKHLAKTQRIEMARFLRNHGYSVYACGGDYFAVNKARNKRLQRLARARCGQTMAPPMTDHVQNGHKT